LIVTAERLFAERGLEGVSLRELGVETGQRNTRVAQYHFGDKAGLIRAVFEYRLPAIDRRRRELLDKLERDGRTTDVRGLLEALMLPQVEQMGPDNRYVGFLDRLSHVSGPRHPYHGLDPNLTFGALRARDLLMRAVPAVPRPLRTERFRLVTTFMVARLAALQAEQEAGLAPGEHDTIVSNLLDALTALFCVAPSIDTKATLRRARRRATTA
jgi:AcrR family transcriptional regulator